MIPDYCTGRQVDETKPEEPVRQEIERWLVEEMRYSKSNIDIEQRIRAFAKIGRADVAVLRKRRGEPIDQQEDILGLVETKAKSIDSAVKQLKTYMAVSSSCEWGVAATPETRLFFRRYNENTIERIHSIPLAGMSIESADRIKKSDLKPTKNLKWRFKSILFHLYSNTNIQSRAKLSNELTKILFCKIYDERYGPDVPVFQFSPDENAKVLKERIESKLWAEVRKETAYLFDKNESIVLDSDSVAWVVGELERVSLLETDYDVIGAAFEVFAERYFVGEKGEFFTPRIAVKNAIDMMAPQYREKIIDPACGSGGFLVQALEYVWKGIDERGGGGRADKLKKAPEYIYGMDKEPDLVKVAKSYMSLVGDGHTKIVDDDSLKPADRWQERTRVCMSDENKNLTKFDIVVTNPPFGSKIKVKHDDVLGNYVLGLKWNDKEARNNWARVDDFENRPPVKQTEPQILFLEHCYNLLEDNGRMCIVLPESVVANPTTTYVRQWLLDHMEVTAVWDCPQKLFLPHTNTKTCILFLRKRKAAQQRILMSHIKNCGHDQRGMEIRGESGELKEDFSSAVEDWRKFDESKSGQNEETEYEISKVVDRKDLDEYLRLVPRDFFNVVDPEGKVTLSELKVEKLISVSTISCSVKQFECDPESDVPYLRTTDIGVMEPRPTIYKVPEAVYERERQKQRIRANDILITKDGTFRIGEPIIIRGGETKIVVQGHFYRIRSKDPDKICPYFLYWALMKAQPDILAKAFVQATLSSITMDRLLKVMIHFPDKKTRNRIGERMKAALDNRRAEKETLDNLSTEDD